jgi:F0F1-type ATP synthase delta subunit
MKLYQLENKEEKITILSAYELSSSERDEVESALKQNPDNSGKEFTIEFEVDEAIVGGLQLYTESKFMDMSVSSRIERISAEFNKIVD